MPTPTGTPPAADEQIVFTRRAADSSYGDIWVMNADGTGQRQLTFTGDATEPALSPDGTRITFERNISLDGFIRHVYVMNNDGTGITRLTTGARGAFAPAWSPDGNRIAFHGGTASATGEENIEIFVMNADGTGTTRLTNSARDDLSPAWSPDGTRIVFGSARTAGAGRGIYLINADGAGETQVTAATTVREYSPVFSPNGTTIAFSSGTISTCLLIDTVAVDGTDRTSPPRPRAAASAPAVP